MTLPSRSERNLTYILLTHTACLCLGIGMILWGLAPTLVNWIVSGRVPDLSTFPIKDPLLALGCAFLGLSLLVRRRIRSSLWVTFLLSALLTAGGLALITVNGIRLSSTFLPLVSGGTCFAGWLAIATSPRRPLKTAIRNALGFKAGRPMFTEPVRREME